MGFSSRAQSTGSSRSLAAFTPKISKPPAELLKAEAADLKLHQALRRKADHLAHDGRSAQDMLGDLAEYQLLLANREARAEEVTYTIARPAVFALPGPIVCNGDCSGKVQRICDELSDNNFLPIGTPSISGTPVTLGVCYSPKR